MSQRAYGKISPPTTVKSCSRAICAFLFSSSCLLYFLNFLLLLLYSPTLLLLPVCFCHRLCFINLCSSFRRKKKRNLCLFWKFLENKYRVLFMYVPLYLAHRRDSTNVCPIEWINVFMSGLTKSEHNSFITFLSSRVFWK